MRNQYKSIEVALLLSMTFVLYNSILLLSTFFIYLSDKISGKYGKLFFVSIAFLILYLPAAIRFNIGSDYLSYKDIFYTIASSSAVKYELGFVYLNKIIYFFGFGYETLVAVSSFIAYAIFFKSYPIKGAWVIHFLFVCSLYLYLYSNIRSGFVYSIMFLAVIDYILRKNVIRFLALIAVSFSFHKSALIYLMIPLLFVPGILYFITKRYVCELLIILLLFLLFNANIVYFFIFSNPLVESLGFSRYMHSSKWGAETEIGTGLGLIIRIFPVVLYVLLRDKFAQFNSNYKEVTALCLVLLFAVSCTLALKVGHRVEKLFVFVYFIVLYDFYRARKVLLFRYFLIFMLVFYVAVFNKSIYDSKLRWVNNWEGYSNIIYPYVTIFNKEDSDR